VFYKDVVRDIQARKLMARQRLTGPLPEKKDSAASTKEAWSAAHLTQAPGAALRELEERGDYVTTGTPLQTFTKLDVIIAKMRVAAAHRKGIEVKYKQPLGTSKSNNSQHHSRTQTDSKKKRKKKLPWVAPRLYRFFDESVQVGCNYKVRCTPSYDLRCQTDFSVSMDVDIIIFYFYDGNTITFAHLFVVLTESVPAIMDW
jgi:hypothetical protein